MTSPYYLGGMTPFKTGWLGPRAVFVEFASDLTDSVYQLYAGRKLIGSTISPRERRVSGQLLVDDAPCPLTVVRVPSANRLTDYGPLLPAQPFNRFALEWAAAGYPADAKCFEITASLVAGDPADPDNVLARVEYIGDRSYRFQLPPLPSGGVWTYRITPRDDALPSGNAGTATDVEVDAVLPPADLEMDDDGNRFSLALSAGELTASFEYAEA